MGEIPLALFYIALRKTSLTFTRVDMLRPTIKSIAQELGISHATVSMALRDNPLIKIQTRERIKQAAAALGYIPNGIAQAMRSQQVSILGVIVGNMGNSFTGLIVEAIESQAQQHGYQCLICQTHGSQAELEQEIRVLEKHRTAGLIIQALDFENQVDFYNRVLRPFAPCVFCDGEVPGYPSSAVLSDSRAMGFLATQHLIDLGHQRIAWLQGPDRNAQERFKGYCRALKKAALPLDENLIVRGGWGFKEGVRSATELVSRGKPFSALIASSDPVAVGAMQALKKADLHIPGDVSVIGAGNHDFAGFVTPTLTSIEQNPGEIGRRSMNMLFDLINDPKKPFRQSLIKPQLMARESTAARKRG
ncbi:MAG: LacI family DNA-binding transcriptional regulator [Chthoniobacteraceae bacterium]